MTRHITLAYKTFHSDKRINVPIVRPNEREPRIMIRIGMEQIEMGRREFMVSLRTLETAEAAGGTDPIAWRKFITTAEGDFVQECERAIHCEVVKVPSEKYPDGHALVIGFEGADGALAAKEALNIMLKILPPGGNR